MGSNRESDGSDVWFQVTSGLAKAGGDFVEGGNASLFIGHYLGESHIRIDRYPRSFRNILNPLLLLTEMHQRFVSITSNGSRILRRTTEHNARSMIGMIFANLDIFVDYPSHQCSDGASSNYYLGIEDRVPPVAWVWVRRVMGGLALCVAALVFYCGFILVSFHGFTPATLAGLVLIDLCGFVIAWLGCVGLIG